MSESIRMVSRRLTFLQHGNPSISSEQVERVVQIDLLADVQLIFGPGHVVQQKFENERAAEAAALDLELRKAHRE